MGYRIVHCRWERGERYVMLVEAATGIPPWYPMLFVTTQLRNAGRSVATMEASLGAIQLLLEHTEAKGMNLEERVLKREFLARNEIDTLCDEAQRRRQTNRGTKKTVSVGHHYKRLSVIANYLQWFAHEVLDNRRTGEDDKAIKKMIREIRSRRPPWDGRRTRKDRAITDEQFDRLMQIIEPEHPDNPFEDQRTAMRNRLALLLLVRLGIRKGELLGIRVGDIDWTAETLRIERRADDQHDPRTRQPKTKTLARTLPLFPELMTGLRDYVMRARRRTKGANTHNVLLVVHKKGPNEGQPLSESGIDKVFRILRASDPLLQKVHPHALRHYWNWQFSCAMDEMPVEKSPSREDQRAMREHQMGWAQGSGTAAEYDVRFTERKAKEAALALAERTRKSTHR